MPSGFHTWSQTAATNNSADSAINWSEGQAPSTINDSARAQMAVQAKWRDDNNGSLTTGGTSTAYTLTTNTVFTTLALMANQTLAFTMSATSGATPTLNVDGLGAKVIRTATGVALPTGALLSGSIYRATYNNVSGEWLLHNQSAVLPTNIVATANIVDANVTLAKIVNTAASRLLGNPTGSPAAPSEISLGAGLSFSGTTVVSTLDATLVPGFLSGLELSTAGSSATFGIAVGGANDVSQGGMMVLSSAYTKTTSAWAVGSTNGGLDTSTIATSTWYHVFLIKRTDTGVVDVLFSLSPTAPTMPTNYTLKRRIGSMKTNGSSQWTAFVQLGDEFLWLVPVLDSNTTVLSTVATTVTLASVPTGIQVQARIGGTHSNAAVNDILITSLDATSSAVNTPTGNSTSRNAVGAQSTTFAPFYVRTNTSAQIRTIATASSTTLNIVTSGWIETRGK